MEQEYMGYFDYITDLQTALSEEYYYEPLFDAETINEIRNKNYANERLLNIIKSRPKINVFYESTQYDFELDFYKILFETFEPNEISTAFGLCCQEKNIEIINMLTENGYRPTQEQMALYFYGSDENEDYILEYCLKNGMTISRRNLIDIYSWENQKLIEILRKYNCTL